MIRPCDYCGKDYNTSIHGRHYCSRTCMRARRSEESESRRARACKWCGKEFIARHPSGKANRGESNEGTYCSRACRGFAATLKAGKDRCLIYINECCVCGKLFLARPKTKTACSDLCRRKKNNSKSSEYQRAAYIGKPKKQMECKICGRVFYTSMWSRKTCSIKCSKINNRLITPKSHRSRARKFGVEYEYINPAKVFDRDGWHCQICGKHTPLTRRGSRYSNAPELDHRIPLSNGGGHLYSNVQCVCRACNSNKSNKDSRGQLPLFELRACAQAHAP